jgi:YHS domain-containing protein
MMPTLAHGRRAALALAVCHLMAVAAAAAGVDPVNKTLFSGLAIKGYDPVAYFNDGKPVKGVKEFQHDWNGARWQFSSGANRDLFKANPDKYAPQYGGYCAKAVSEGSTADISPDAWKIVGGKLYLNYDRRVQKTWEENFPERIKKADANWPRILRGEK